MENLKSVPVTGPVTEEERAYAINALNTTRDALHQSLAGLSDIHLTYKPSSDRWSIGECLEHITLIEQGIFAVIQKGMTYPANPEKRAEIKYSDVDVIKAVRSRAVTFPSHDPYLPVGHFDSVSASLAAFNEQREAVITFVQTVTEDLRTHYFRHIALGWLDIYQGMLVLASHVERHRKQIEEIKSSLGFPQ